MLQNSGFLKFRLDPLLSSEQRKRLDGILTEFKDAEITEIKDWNPSKTSCLQVDLVSESSLHLLRPGPHLKICLLDRNQGLFSFGQNLESSLANAVLDDSINQKQLEHIVKPRLELLMTEREDLLTLTGMKNLRRFELAAKNAGAGQGNLRPETLLDFALALVDLEKELIHADDASRIQKITRQFVKVFLGKSKFQFIDSSVLVNTNPSRSLLALPRFKGGFQALEMSWEEEESLSVIQKFFFYNTLAHFFHSLQGTSDPFFDEDLWENALDSIPFPVALMSHKAEVHQHNSLFGKLHFAPVDCLKLKLREKTVIHEIPYNIFRKEIHHLDEDKVLFVFFTESFFLKGDGNLTPSGQELGIISSSIAHELNNPIAGIQAALSVLLLEDDMGEEADQTLREMKNGAMRCKQLIETFLGFSRANPLNAQGVELIISPIEVCYQQAQNLLRFRTVESGIRFSLEYSRHSEFRAEVNLSMLTMTFYLIMGELMTLYSHQLLVANKNQIEKVIKGEIVESSHEVQIQLHELNISQLDLSKLIQNLLKIENFVLQISDYSLRFIHSPSKDA
ncbi:MAG TPA: histidine kinase dimerization/phospho-acceptor domain-containing protein [Bacteriovoracaceae bacterium]|nr:histidine kinase dimerization/phospho-acceptor domain-containing protein [Bacteriovoracaceae bacterium]